MELRLPNQCSLDKRIKNNNDFVSTICFNKNQTSDKANERYVYFFVYLSNDFVHVIKIN